MVRCMYIARRSCCHARSSSSRWCCCAASASRCISRSASGRGACPALPDHRLTGMPCRASCSRSDARGCSLTPRPSSPGKPTDVVAVACGVCAARRDGAWVAAAGVTGLLGHLKSQTEIKWWFTIHMCVYVLETCLPAPSYQHLKVLGGKHISSRDCWRQFGEEEIKKGAAGCLSCVIYARVLVCIAKAKTRPTFVWAHHA